MNSLQGGNVLLVEGDEQVRSLVRTLLTTNGYHVLEASNGHEALAIVQREDASVDLLLADMLLRELSGFDLAQQALLRHPRMKILFMTGYVENDIVQRCMTELQAYFIDKPFQPSALLNLIREAFRAGV